MFHHGVYYESCLFSLGYVGSTDTAADGSLAAVRRLSEVEPMRGSHTEGAQCMNSLVTATLRLFLPSSMASMTSLGLHTKRSVHPWGHMQSQGSAVFNSPAAGLLYREILISCGDQCILHQADADEGITSFSCLLIENYRLGTM